MLKQLSVALVSVLLSVGLLLGANRIVGATAESPTFPLLFVPLSVAEYETSEFHFTARINRLGFRDREFALETPAGRTRILAIGDSFTYGWGVEIEDSWPKVLERALREQGLDVEVANLGRVGAGPYDYARAAAEALDLLKPDLIIVAVLQGNDLQALLQPPDSGSLRRRVVRVFDNLRLSPPEIASTEFRREWRAQAAGVLGSFTPEQRARFDALSEPVREGFLSGEFSPSYIQQSMIQPDAYSALPGHRGTLARRLTDTLVGIRDEAAQYGCRVRAVSVPLGAYVGATGGLRALGFTLPVDTDFPDTVLSESATAAGIPAAIVTDAFRDGTAGHAFFPLDGHFNEVGHRRFADAVHGVLFHAVR